MAVAPGWQAAVTNGLSEHVINPIQFGAPARRLFGIYHPGAAAAQPSRSVLLCNPFGQESIRVHRFYRVLADRLSRAGLNVLRFDPYGTGDSMGDDQDVTIAGWLSDLRTAHLELSRLAPGSSVEWVGTRLGATLALLAIEEMPASLSGLTLWEPLIDGAEYRRMLRERHAAALSISYGLIGPDWRAMLDDKNAFADEAIGFSLSPVFVSELCKIDLRSTVPHPSVRVRVLGDPNDTLLSTWMTQCRAAQTNVDFTPLVHDFDWTAEEAVNTPLVPAKALQYFMSALAG